ncbi:MAG: hypothetical protein QMD96_06560 [Anaerosomatales bacterium]|nr:hypothetical protein [Anaerosomatales bacterium]
MSWMQRLAASALLAAAFLAAAGCARQPEPAAPSEASTPEQLIESRCTQCHDRGRIDAASYDAAGWTAVIDRMVAKGARLTEEEKAALVEHLAAD